MGHSLTLGPQKVPPLLCALRTGTARATSAQQPGTVVIECNWPQSSFSANPSLSTIPHSSLEMSPQSEIEEGDPGSLTRENTPVSQQQLSCVCVVGSYKGTLLGENMIFLFPSWSLCNGSSSFLSFFVVSLFYFCSIMLRRWGPWGDMYLLLGQVFPAVNSLSLWAVSRLMGETRLDNGLPCPPQSQVSDLLLVGEVLPPQGTFTVSRKEKNFCQLDLTGGGQGVWLSVCLQQSTLQLHLTSRILPVLYSTGAYHVFLGVEGQDTGQPFCLVGLRS